MVCSTERSTPGSTQGSDGASSLTLKTAVKPESEESSTQFQRTAYSGSPSLFFHLARLRASITYLPQNLGIVSDREGPYPLRLQIARRSIQRLHEDILHLEGSLINRRTVSGSWLFCEGPG